MFSYGKAAVKEFESLIEIILINNFDCSLEKLFPFYLPTLHVCPKDIQFLRLTELGAKTTQIDVVPMRKALVDHSLFNQ